MSVEGNVDGVREKLEPRSNIVPEISLYSKIEDVVYDWRENTRTHERHIKYKTKRYFLPLKQVPTDGVNLVDTDPVNAVVTFYDSERNKLEDLSTHEGFWYGSKPRAKMQSRQDRDVVIRKSGRVEGVCLVIRKVGHKGLYAFNQNSYIPGTGDFQFKRSMKLLDKTTYARVEISDGATCSGDFWVKITNQGRDKDPEFDLLPESPLK